MVVDINSAQMMRNLPGGTGEKKYSPIRGQNMSKEGGMAA